MKTTRLRTGTLASLAGLAALIVLSADVRQMYFWSQGMHCEDGDRNGCDAITEPAPPKPSTPAHQSRRLDANENLKLDANGNAAGFVVSSRTGARARVGSRYAARFQAYIDDLENNHGARVLFMGGIRPGSCSRASEHPCGKALDVCQLRRGVVDRRCKLPERAELGRIAASHGLFEGGRWCNSDYGHAQVDVTPACGESRNRIARKNTIEQQEQVPQKMPTLAASY